jgi:cytochrome c5
MNDPQKPSFSRDEGGPAKTSLLHILALILFLVAVVVGIKLAVNYSRSQNGSEEEIAVASRIEPIAQVEIQAVAAVGGPPKTGEEVYKAQCAACHAAGTLGSPKFGDAPGWASRITKPFETLVTHALKGFNSMPAQGGGQFNDYEISRAVVYMTNNAGAKFAEPAAPADAASGAASASAPAQ